MQVRLQLVRRKDMITHHTQLLNALIEKHNLKSYLEIGVQNPANNFDKVNITYKEGIDPEITPFVKGPYILINETSDEYFSRKFIKKHLHFDLIFIDGLHHADQVKRDFENSLRCLSDNGFIVIHDVLPENEAGTIVPRETKQWWGDVYKWAMRICEYDNIEYITYNIDNGCMVVRKHDKRVQPFFKRSMLNIPPPLELAKILNSSIVWVQYKTHGVALMNVTSEVEI